MRDKSLLVVLVFGSFVVCLDGPVLSVGPHMLEDTEKGLIASVIFPTFHVIVGNPIVSKLAFQIGQSGPDLGNITFNDALHMLQNLGIASSLGMSRTIIFVTRSGAPMSSESAIAM